MSELRRKCAKCHITATESDDPNLRFHRFPLPGKHGPLKARVWAEYCYPAGNWSTEKSLKSLQQQHKMLCSKHFDDSSYTSSSRKRLNNYAIPTGTEGIMLKLRQEQCAASSDTSFNILKTKLQGITKTQKEETVPDVTPTKPCFVADPTDFKLSTEDRLSSTLCYICYSLLQKCHRFSDMAHQSEEILRNQLSKDVTNCTPPICLALNLVIEKNLSVTVAQAFKEECLNNEELVTSGDMYGNNYICFNEDTPATINIEIKVKREHNLEDEGLVKLEDEDFVKTEKSTDDEMNNDMQVREHSSTKDKTKNFYCKLCNQNFNSKCLLMIHLKTHRAIKPLACSKCRKSYSKVSYLRKHLISCPGKPEMTCSKCNKIFTDIDNFEIHIKTHISHKQCNLCKKMLKKNNLKCHMLSHNVEKPFECEVCGKFFKSPGTLRVHVKSHTDGKAFECDTCGKSYRFKGNLKAHMMCHSGEKPFICKICGAAFRCKSTLNTHIERLHNKVKAFACNLCYRSFSHETNLAGHMRSHTEEKRISCDLCNKKFLTNRYLKLHVMYVHSKERPFVCVCGKSYKNPKTLREHYTKKRC